MPKQDKLGKDHNKIEHEDLEVVQRNMIEGRLDDERKWYLFNELDLLGKDEERGGYWGYRFTKKHTSIMKKNAPMSMNNRRKLVKLIVYFIGLIFFGVQSKNMMMAIAFGETSFLWSLIKMIFGLVVFFIVPKYYFYKELINYNYPDGIHGEKINGGVDFNQSFIERQKMKFENFKTDDNTVFSDLDRYKNLDYYKAKKNRPMLERTAKRKGLELANKMGLWTVNENRGRGGQYSAMAFDDEEGNIYFSATTPPTHLKMSDILENANNIKDEYQIKIIRDGRNMEDGEVNGRIYESVIVTQQDNNFFLPKNLTVLLMKHNPLKKGFVVNSADEIEVENNGGGVKVYNTIDIDNKIRPTTLNEVSGILVGGLPGAGKSAFLITLCSALIKQDLIDLTILDLKGDSTDWDNFKDVANIVQFEKNYTTGESNLEEIHDMIQTFADGTEQRMRTFRDETGSTNFWHEPVTPKNKIRMIVIDECQEAFDTTGMTNDEKATVDKIISQCTRIVKKHRSYGGIAVFATQRPDQNSVPTPIRSNCGMRIAFRLAEKTVETMTLGTPADDETISATDIGGEGMQGTAVISNGSDGKREMIRYAYLDSKDLAEEMEEVVEERGSIHEAKYEQEKKEEEERRQRKERLKQRMKQTTVEKLDK